MLGSSSATSYACWLRVAEVVHSGVYQSFMVEMFVSKNNETHTNDRTISPETDTINRAEAIGVS